MHWMGSMICSSDWVKSEEQSHGADKGLTAVDRANAESHSAKRWTMTSTRQWQLRNFRDFEAT